MNGQREPVFWPWFVALAGGSGGVVYFLVQGDKLTAAALTTVIVTALIGYGMRAGRFLRLLAGLLVASLLAPPLAPLCQKTFAGWFLTGELGQRLLSLAVPAVLIIFLVSLFLKRLSGKYLSCPPALARWDQAAGFCLGACQGAVLCWFIIGGLLVLDPIARLRHGTDTELRDHKLARVIAGHVIEYASLARESAVGTLVADCNPFDRLPPLREMRPDLDGLGDPITKTPTQTELAVDAHFAER